MPPRRSFDLQGRAHRLVVRGCELPELRCPCAGRSGAMAGGAPALACDPLAVRRSQTCSDRSVSPLVAAIERGVLSGAVFLAAPDRTWHGTGVARASTRDCHGERHEVGNASPV